MGESAWQDGCCISKAAMKWGKKAKGLAEYRHQVMYYNNSGGGVK